VQLVSRRKECVAVDDLVNQVQELLDRRAIADCVHRYCRGIDRGDIDLVASCYHDDAIDDHGHYVGPGRGLAEWATERMSDLLRNQHHITTHNVELDGDTAHSEAYYIATMREPDGITKLVSGRYLDRFERRNGEWRIAQRVCMVETIADVATADMEVADVAYAPGSHDRSDRSYERPLRVTRRSPDDPHLAIAARSV
jgi:ketosteroid isomerase-like protein